MRAAVVKTLVACLLAACVHGQGRAASVGDTRAAVRAAARAWNDAMDRRDVEGAVRWFADDIVAWYPQPQPTLGLEANRDGWREAFATPNYRHPITTDTVVVAASGDVAYTMGRFRVHYEPPGKPPVEAGGRYVAIWKRVGTDWRIAVLSAHQHKPTPALP